MSLHKEISFETEVCQYLGDVQAVGEGVWEMREFFL